MTPLLGGVVLGSAASALLLVDGRVAGVSGIVAGALRPGDRAWRLAFLAGLALAGLIGARLAPEALRAEDGPLAPVAAAGLLVGVGTRLANGCTSGHGVCGLSRGSPRSLAATLVFLGTGALTATVAGLVARSAP